ncbi:MAG: YidC/Oxa1 family insertase periplasmic-domain containing protein, partial [Anaerohalosphaera sp.]|nr:YidC/Oxa1 family insertase periplasmic-domain containing protein [Anaerohalosphaera sp.]
MKTKTTIIVSLSSFLLLCAFLVMQSGLFDCSEVCPKGLLTSLTAETETDAPQPQPEAKPEPVIIRSAPILPPLTAIDSPSETVTLGSSEPESEYKFAIELTTKGAAIKKAIFSEYDNRNHKDPQQLQVLSPIEVPSPSNPQKMVGKYTLASGTLNLSINGQNRIFPLDRLNWGVGKIGKDGLGVQSVSFEAVIGDGVSITDNDKTLTGQALKITKTYSIAPDSYDVNCNITVENLTKDELTTQLRLQGPIGINLEGTRSDARNIIAAFRMSDGKIESIKRENAKLRKFRKNGDIESMQLKMKKQKDQADGHFIWAATTNKYFAAILRPVPAEGAVYPVNIIADPAEYYDPGINDKKTNGDENISFSVRSLSTVGAGASETVSFHLFLGPKDKPLFTKNELYKNQHFVATIQFLSCCCPDFIINPMSFTVMMIMKVMYGVIPNYGVVIIIFVAFVRLLMHPVTKKSQVSMMKMQKLGPMTEEIKKKYGNNKAEMQKQIMKLYRDQGVSPVSSMLPMMIQMPIWISLYSAIYANTALRGAAFLPFWITDLSAPDALVRFPEFVIPLIGIPIDSFNLMPILLAVAMFMQQKLMS